MPVDAGCKWRGVGQAATKHSQKHLLVPLIQTGTSSFSIAERSEELDTSSSQGAERRGTLLLHMLIVRCPVLQMPDPAFRSKLTERKRGGGGERMRTRERDRDRQKGRDRQKKRVRQRGGGRGQRERGRERER